MSDARPNVELAVRIERARRTRSLWKLLRTWAAALRDAVPLVQRRRIEDEANALLSARDVDVEAPEHVEQRRPSTLLATAASLGAVAFVDALVAAGAALDRPDWLNNTPLQLAVAASQHACVERLLLAGASRRSLVNRVARGDVPMLELLLRFGVDIAETDLRVGFSTRLYFAAQDGDALVLTWLLRHRVPCDAPGFANRTPLFNAARHRSHACVLACLAAGADPNRVCHSNAAWPLDECYSSGASAVLLVLAGADVARSRASDHITSRLKADLANVEMVARLRAELAAARADMLWWRARPQVLDVLIALAPKRLPTSVVVDIVHAVWPAFERLPFHWTWNLAERVCRRRKNTASLQL